MTQTKTRHHDLDWLRALGMAGIFLFHNARYFDEDGWHVKNPALDFGATVFVNILNQFIMPLFFVLSAYAIYYALQHRVDREFMRERVTRLLVPLIFGIFFLIPPQVYLERVTNNEFSGTFIQFIPKYFDGWY
ncbi:MAG: acyltransferase family protein, partial [Chloroflexi bacterium]|nr:acyltransferase family protein [Chloroflexota bacterium]